MLAAQIFLGKKPYGLIKIPKFNLMAWQTSENHPTCRAHFPNNLKRGSPIKGNETAQRYSAEGLALSNLGLLLQSSQITIPLRFQLLHTDTICWVLSSPSKKPKSRVLSVHFVQAVFPVFENMI